MTRPGDLDQPHRNDSLSQVALWSMIIGILGMCIPLICLAALVMGIVGITQTSGGKRPGLGFAIAGTALGVIGVFGTCLSVAILLPALGAARQTAVEIKSQTQLRSIGQALVIYANSNDDQFPPVETRFDVLLDQGLLEDEILVSPAEDGDGVSYIFTNASELTFDGTEIVAYEDPKHFQDYVLVLFGDTNVDRVGHAEFEAMLAGQEAARNATP